MLLYSQEGKTGTEKKGKQRHFAHVSHVYFAPLRRAPLAGAGAY
jgi:hypothetical protein